MTNRLPEKLTQLRKHYQYAQGDVATRLGIPVTEYMKWENGNSICTAAQLKQLADLYHISVDSLVDNLKDITFDNSLNDSVQIPFSDISMTQQIDPADNMMPVDGVLPPRNEDGDTVRMDTDSLGNTRVVGDQDLDQGETQIVEPQKESYEEEKRARRNPDDNRKKDAGKKKKKKQSAIIIGAVAAVVVVLALIIVLMRGCGTTVTPGDSNRLAVGSTYTLYVNKSGSYKEYGKFSSSASFDNAVQVSAFDGHAAALLRNGKAVDSSNSKTVNGWEDVTYIAAGKKHTAAVTGDGKVKCTGSDKGCDVSDWSNIEKVYAGDDITIGLTNDGTLRTAGGNANPVSGMDNVADVSINDSMIAVLKKDGTVDTYVIGSGTKLSTSDWSDITAIAAGDTVIAGLKKDGTVECSASDDSISDAVSQWKRMKYIAANGNTVVGFDSSDNMYGAGDNNDGQYTNTDSSTPEPTASASASADKLDKPKNIQVSETTANIVIKWDKVKNADSYKVNISGIGDQPATNTNQVSIAATQLTDGQEYTITVTAIPKDTDKYSESSASYKYTYKAKTVQLGTPGDITSHQSSDGWSINWSAVDHADYYTISFNGGAEMQVNSTTYSVSSDDLNPGTYTVAVKAYSATPTYTESEAGTAQVNLTYADKAYTVLFKDSSGNVVFTASNVQLTPGQSYSAGAISQKSGGSSTAISNHTISSQEDITPSPGSSSVDVLVDN